MEKKIDTHSISQHYVELIVFDIIYHKIFFNLNQGL